MRIYETSIQYKLLRLGDDVRLDSSAKVIPYMEGAFDDDPTVEWFYAILLDRKNQPLGRTVVSRGTASSTLVHPREVFKSAILASATGVILVHNHPSGDPAPSTADIKVTQQLRDASKVIGIDLIDHIIIGYAESDPAGLGYHSFQEKGLL